MASAEMMTASTTAPRSLPVNKIDVEDLAIALRKGVDDFRSRPSHYVFLALIYPIAGVALGLWTSGASAWPVLYPLVAGFALVGPLAALGFYEISRRREQGLASKWSHALEVRHSPAMPSIAAVGLVLVGLFIVWLISAHLLSRQVMGSTAFETYGEFLSAVLTTRSGWVLILAGNVLGLVFAVIAFAVSVVSLPLLLDRDVGAVVAIKTSVRAVRDNPRPMALWGLLVAGLLVSGTVLFLVGLAVVVPVLGHSTWHLYRRLVPRGPGGRADCSSA